MSEKKISYGEYAILGVNKGLTAFLFSFILCLLLSLVINLRFYQELIMLTVGSLGEVGAAGSDTILRTTGLLLGLSFFQTSGKFQMGLLLLSVIPLSAFFSAGLLFRLKKPKDSYVNLISSVIIDGLAAAVYALFLFITAFLTKGVLFGVEINFASGRNLLFSLLFAVFIQFILGINRHKKFTNFTAGLLRTRNLLWLTLGFSALTGILFILYYLTPYLKSLVRILAFALVFLPNLAVYLSFMLMGVPLDLADSLGTLSNYLRLNTEILNLPVSIKVQLIISFIVLVFIVLLKMPVKKYWQNLCTFALGYSLSMLILAMSSRVDLGYVKGAFNIGLAVSPVKAFAVPFVIIWLDGLLLRLIRQIYRELCGESPKGAVASFLLGAEEEEVTYFKKRLSKKHPEADFSETDVESEPESEAEQTEKPAETPEEEIDIWKELAARPIPSREEYDKPRILLWNEREMLPVKKWGNSSEPAEAGMDNEAAEALNQEGSKPSARAEDTGAAKQPQPQTDEAEERAAAKSQVPGGLEQLPEPSEKEGAEASNSGWESERPAESGKEPKKEIDISLFPGRKKKAQAARSWMDFSDVEDELLPDEYEAEEILEDFVEKEENLTDTGEIEAEEGNGQTKVIRREKEAEDWERTIPYQIIRK